MINILVVEDEDLALRYCINALRKVDSEIEPIPAKSAEDAFAILEQFSIDGAFIDIKLPGISGLEFADKIRKIDKYHLLPIIFATGEDHNCPEIYQQYRNHDYIQKPFTKDVFIRKSTRFIEAIKTQNRVINKKEERIILLQTDTGDFRVALLDILYIDKTPLRKIRIITRGQEFLRSYTSFQAILAEINDENLVYCNQSCIVNIPTIEKIVNITHKTWDIHFYNAPGIKCPLSYKYHAEVTDKWHSMVDQDDS